MVRIVLNATRRLGVRGSFHSFSSSPRRRRLILASSCLFSRPSRIKPRHRVLFLSLFLLRLRTYPVSPLSLFIWLLTYEGIRARANPRRRFDSTFSLSPSFSLALFIQPSSLVPTSFLSSSVSFSRLQYTRAIITFPLEAEGFIKIIESGGKLAQEKQLRYL